jgi:hypothetical protein
VVYKDGDTRGSWASRGVNAFYLGPAKDHYRCDKYYIPETRAYCVSGSTELFPQHCQLPSMPFHQHLRALTDELTEHTAQANNTPKGRRLLKLLSTRIDGLLHPPAPMSEQRVNDECQRATREAKQRVIDDSPIITIPRLTDAPPVMITRNPTAKRILRNTPRLHRRITRNNTPGILPVQNMVPPTPTPTTPAARQKRPGKPTWIQPHRGPRLTRTAIPSGAQQQIVTQHAINRLTLKEQASFDTIHTPPALMKHAKMRDDMEHYANPMVHPVTGHTISSYKKSMHDPTTAEVW